jgi:hypothetical protein
MPTLKIQIPLIWIAVVLFGAIELALLYGYHNSDTHWQNTIVFGASIVAGAFALFSYLKGIEQKRSAAASRIIERWNNPMMTPYKDVMRSIRSGKVSVEPLKRKSREDPLTPEAAEIRSKMQVLLGFFEELCLAIRLSTADEKKLEQFFAAVVTQSYKKSKNWIQNERDIDDEQGYYIEFEMVAKKWDLKVINARKS